MNQRQIAILSIAVVVLIIGGAIAYVKFGRPVQVQNASVAPTQAKAQVGDTAPEFRAATTAGPFDLADGKKPVFLEVFATWCPHCQRETAVINDLYRRYHDRVDFVAVSGSDTGMDGTSPASQLDVLAFQQRFHVLYPIAYDARVSADPAHSVATLYLHDGFPTVVVVDKNRKIAYANSGEIPAPDLEAQIKKVL